jgi:ABC-type transporter Mla MlaB component
VEIVSQQDRAVLYLRGSLGMADVLALREAAVRLAAEPDAPAAPLNAGPSVDPRVRVDMSEIEGVDVGVLQILAALDAEFGRQGRRLVVQRPPETVEGQWRVAGWRGFSLPR